VLAQEIGRRNGHRRFLPHENRLTMALFGPLENQKARECNTKLHTLIRLHHTIDA